MLGTEHIHAIENNRPDTEYCRDIVDTGHTYGNVDNEMTILERAK
jgi:hypothetical protein